jgi:hypothetical protein
MARINAPLLAFNRGEVSKLALARIDIEKMRLAAACQLNWMPFVIGPMMLRPGLQYIGEIAGDNPTAVIDFVFSKLDTALIELTNDNMRVWVKDALVTRVAVGTVVNDPTFLGGGSWSTADTTAGCSASVGGGLAQLACSAVGGLARIKQTLSVAAPDQGKEHALRISINYGPVTVRAGSAAGLADYIAQTSLDAGTHSIAFTPNSASVYLQIDSTDPWIKALTGVSIEAAGVLQIPTPWATSALSTLRWAQSGDIIFVAQYGGIQYKIERRGTHSWSVVKYRSASGPFSTVPPTTINLTPGAVSGNTGLTADRPYFQPGHVDCLFRLFSSGQLGYAALGNQNAFSPTVRVTGVGATARNYTWTIAGSFNGKITLQRSYDGPNSGFVDVSSISAAGTIFSTTGGSGGTPDLDNVIAWERVGFKAGDYTSGVATVISGYGGGGGYGICRVIGYISSTTVTIEILQQFSSLNATPNWLEADWSGVQGWPTSVAFHEGRLWWLGRDRMWGSQSDNYTGYAEIDSQGNSTGDAGVINEVFGEGPVDSVNWALGLTRLLCGREQSIASVRSSSFDQPLTPTNFSVKDCSNQGAQRLPAIKMGKRGIFVQQSGRKVYELFFDGAQLDYEDRDLTRLNLDIGKPGFVDIARVMQPDKMVYLVRSDGQIAALLYDPDDQVDAWWRIQTLGVIENVRVLPSASGIEDDIYVVVRRVINGVTRRFLEKFATRDNSSGGVINQLLDCHLVSQPGSFVTSITLAHLPNTTVAVWADGKYIGTGTTNGSGVLSPLPDGLAHANIVAGLTGSVQSYSGALTNSMSGLAAFNGLPCEVFADQQPSGRIVHVGTLIVSNGVIALPNAMSARNIIAYFGFMAPFMSAKLAYAAQLGTPLTIKKKIDHVGLALFDAGAQSLQIGQRFDVMDALPQYEEGAAVPATTIWSEYDEPMIEVPGEWDTDARLCLLAQAPYPCKVGGVAVGVKTQG